MPLPAGTKYRVVKRGGHNIRLAFHKGDVIEALNMHTGAKHSAAEFKADAKRRQKNSEHMNRFMKGG